MDTTPKMHYGKKLNALNVCYSVESTDGIEQVTVYEQCPGPVGLNCRGKSLGFGSADTVSDALSAAYADASRNLRDGSR